MPDILIRMEMPRTCVDCHDADLPTAIAWLGAKCPWAHGIIDPGVYDLRHERHPDCPLVELPPHGDLISRDDAIRILERIRDHCENYDMSFALNWAAQTIRDLTTIVPAERREE